MIYLTVMQWHHCDIRKLTIHPSIHPSIYDTLIITGLTCSPPSESELNKIGGFSCNSVTNCLNGNTPIDSFANAWTRCGEVQGCTSIVLNPNGNYYLRKADDHYHGTSTSRYIEYSCTGQLSPLTLYLKICSLDDSLIL